MNQKAFISSAKEAHNVATFTHGLTRRALLMSAKRLISYGFNYAKFKNWYGKDFKFAESKKMTQVRRSLEESMTKIVLDSVKDVANNSRLVAHKHIGKVPNKDWDLALFMASIFFGKTYEDRAEEYVFSFRWEIEALMRIGQEKQMTADKILQWYSKVMEDPRSDSQVLEAIASGFISDLKGLSTYRSFRNLNDDMVVRGFNSANRHYWQYLDQKFILAERDDRTCETCLALDGKVFPIKEEVVPVHGSCRCIEIPIFK